MGERSRADLREMGVKDYALEADPEFLDFQEVKMTKIDETKPWKPALEVEVVKADGTRVENLDANTPFFTFVDQFGRKMTVSAEAAGHIDSLHIKGTDPGSQFDYPSLKMLFEDAADKMPKGIAEEPDVKAFDVEMGKHMGKEGLATMQELLASGELVETDIEAAMKEKETVKELNKSGDKEAKQKFIAKFAAVNPVCKIKFQMVRGEVLVPTVDAPKRDTSKLFMVFGPGANGDKTLYTAAPGRNMPRHPNPDQHKDASGVIDQQTFDESSDAWFNTVMLAGK